MLSDLPLGLGRLLLGHLYPRLDTRLALCHCSLPARWLQWSVGLGSSSAEGKLTVRGTRTAGPNLMITRAVLIPGD